MLGDGWAYIEQKGFEKGERKGRDEGRMEGREEGRHEAARAALHTLCTARFGGALDELVARVPAAALNDAIAAVGVAADEAAARRALEALGQR
jgi:flagellar biosynthesis/type III secretory pathway protein FliH